MLFSQLLASIQQEEGSFRIYVSNNWRQGRTLYGGLSAALCVECATRSIGDLPPLRSAQFSFIGPAKGDLRITPSVLRRGKTAVFVAVDLFGEDGLAVRANLVFGNARASTYQYKNVPAPEVARPDTLESLRAYENAFAFSRNFEWRLAIGDGPYSGSKEPKLTQWLQHRDAGVPDSVVALIALADVPPVAIALFSERAPVSTMTWIIDILTDFPVKDDGWRLVQGSADTVADGYSSQSLTVWSSTYKPLLASRQCIAIFA